MWNCGKSIPPSGWFGCGRGRNRAGTVARRGSAPASSRASDSQVTPGGQLGAHAALDGLAAEHRDVRRRAGSAGRSARRAARCASADARLGGGHALPHGLERLLDDHRGKARLALGRRRGLRRGSCATAPASGIRRDVVSAHATRDRTVIGPPLRRKRRRSSLRGGPVWNLMPRVRKRQVDAQMFRVRDPCARACRRSAPGGAEDARGEQRRGAVEAHGQLAHRRLHGVVAPRPRHRAPEGDAGGRSERARRQADLRAAAHASGRLYAASSGAHIHEVAAETAPFDLEVDVEQQGSPRPLARPGARRGRLPAREAAGGRDQFRVVDAAGSDRRPLRK